MTTVREAMIVAGGAGTRLRPLTDTTPKPLLPFCGEPFLASVLRRLAAAGVERVWLVVGPDPTPFRVLDPVAEELSLQLQAVPEPSPLDTAGGVRSAIAACEGSVLVLNGDVLTDLDLALVARRHLEERADATLVLTRVEDTAAYGVCVLEGTRITGFVEKPPPGTLPGQDTINAGTYVLSPGVLDRFPLGRLSFEREVFPGLVEDGAYLQGLVSDAVWADLGTPDRYLAGHRMALRGELDWPVRLGAEADARGVRRGVGVQVDASAEVVGPALLADHVVVEAGARVGPDVVLGAGTRVAEGAHVQDAVLGDGAVVEAGARVRACATGTGARVVGGGVVEGPLLVGDGDVVGGGDAAGGGGNGAGGGKDPGGGNSAGGAAGRGAL